MTPIEPSAAAERFVRTDQDVRTNRGDPALVLTYRLTVTHGLDGVNRVISLLRQRGTHVTAFSARMTPEPWCWVVEYVCIGSKHDDEMLVKRMNRLTSVIKVEYRSPFPPPAPFEIELSASSVNAASRHRAPRPDP